MNRLAYLALLLASAAVGCGPAPMVGPDLGPFADGAADLRPGDGAVAADGLVAMDGGADLAAADLGAVDLAQAPDLARPPQRFAVVGDYGVDDADELHVAQLIKGWTPDFVLTTGDNNYPNGDRATIERNIGKYYAEFIGGYIGTFGPGSKSGNRFWPSVGNHDYYGAEKLQPYLDYFPELPGKKRYYEVQIGRVHLFALNSELAVEPDGNTAGSVQGEWLRQRLAASTACFKIVYFHVPPISSGPFHDAAMDWPYKKWGADVVLLGHEHYYERIERDGFTYIINGLGGAKNRFDFPNIIPESKVRYRDDFGAQLGTATGSGLTLEFFTVGGQKIDTFTIPRNCP